MTESTERERIAVCVAAAAMVGPDAARGREHTILRTERADTVEARARLRDRVLRSRTTAMAVLSPRWWENTSPERVGEAIVAARTLAVTDPDDAQAAENHIREEVSRRWNLDIGDEVPADRDSVRAEYERILPREAASPAIVNPYFDPDDHVGEAIYIGRTFADARFVGRIAPTDSR